MNQRLFVKKKAAFTVEAESLCHDLRNNLNLDGLNHIILYNIYDIYHADAQDLELLKTKVLSEAVTDEVFDEVSLQDRKSVV